MAATKLKSATPVDSKCSFKKLESSALPAPIFPITSKSGKSADASIGTSNATAALPSHHLTRSLYSLNSHDTHSPSSKRVSASKPFILPTEQQPRHIDTFAKPHQPTTSAIRTISILNTQPPSQIHTIPTISTLIPIPLEFVYLNHIDCKFVEEFEHLLLESKHHPEWNAKLKLGFEVLCVDYGPGIFIQRKPLIEVLLLDG